MKKLTLMLAATAIVILAGAYFLLRPGGVTTPGPETPPPESAGGKGQAVNEPDLGFTLTLPPGFTAEKNGDFSRIYYRQTREPGAGPANFVYISAVPKNSEGAEGTIYNYSRNDIAKLRSMQPGDLTALGDNADPDLASYFTYKRADDVMLGGFGTKTFVNGKPWEFPAGTTEYRYLTEFDRVTYIAGGYVGAGTEGSHLSKAELDDIFATIRFTPETILVSTATPASEGDRKTYTSAEAGLSFEYPGNWEENPAGQSFPDGDLFSLIVRGETQRPQTEMYDGVIFAVMKPVETPDEVMAWMKEQYESADPVDPERPPQYSAVAFGGIRYEKVVVCGLGCFPYYHTKQNGKIYGFLGLAAGPNAKTYESEISRIISSVNYTAE